MRKSRLSTIAGAGTVLGLAATLSLTTLVARVTPPTARDTVVTTQAGRQATGTLAGSVAGTPTYELLSTGSSGLASLTNSSTGSFNYVPGPGFTGLDQFTYRVSDGATWSAPATVFAYVVATSQAPAPVFRASTTGGGGEANGSTEAVHGSISADGRYIAFASGATNLTPTPPPSGFGVYLKDLQTGAVILAADGFVFPHQVRISDDGQHVAFATQSRLVPSDTNGGELDVYVFDRPTGTIERVSVATDGTQGDLSSVGFAISANGRYVAFDSFARTFAPNDNKTVSDVFLRDRVAGTTTLISVSSTGVAGDRPSGSPVVSADGRYVLFNSQSNNLVATPMPDQATRVYLRDVVTGTTTLVSQSAEGAPANGETFAGGMSPDGRHLLFHTRANNLIQTESLSFIGGFQVYVRDRVTGDLSRVGRSVTGGFLNALFGGGNDISADGRFVVIGHQASNLVPGDTNGRSDFFVADRRTRVTRRISVSSTGGELFPPFDSDLRGGAISSDGRYAVFSSGLGTVVPGDGNGFGDVFVAAVTIDALGHIAGTVTDSGGAPLASVEIALFDADGREVASALTDASGQYEFRDLPAGTYSAHTRNGQGYVNESFGGTACLMCPTSAGDPVVIQAGATTASVDFSLALGGSIAGTMTDAAAATGVSYGRVTVYTAAGMLAAQTTTDQLGQYTVANLPAGSYRVHGRAFGRQSQAFSGVACAAACAPTTGTPVSVLAALTTAGTDLALAPIAPVAHRIYSRGATEVKLSDADEGLGQEVAIHGGLGDAIDVSPDGSLVYVADGMNPNNRILTLDAATFTPIRTFTLPFTVWQMALSPDGLRLFVAEPPVNDVTPIHVLDAATGATLGTSSLISSGGRLLFSPDGTALYRGVHRLDTTTLVASMVPLGPLAFTPDGRYGYTIARGERLPGVIDMATGEAVSVLAPGLPTSDFIDVAVTADGMRALFLDWRSPTLWMFDTSTHDLIGTIPLTGLDVIRIAAAPLGSRAYVSGRNGIIVVDLLSGSVVTTIPLRSGGANLRVSPVAREGVYFDPSTTANSFITPFVAEYGRTVTLRARLYRRGFGVPDKTLTFTLNGSPVGTAVTDSAGRAVLSGVSVAGMAVGVHEDAAVASFAGDGTLPASSHTVDLTIVRATPLITWTPAPLVAGAALGAPQLNATADVAGSFSYTPSAGATFGVGLVQASASFTPADLTNYTTTSANRSISVYFEAGGSSPRPEQKLAVPAYAQYPLGFDASSGLIYAPRSPNIVAIINGVTNTVDAELVLQNGPVSAFPLAVAVDTPARRAYVSSGQHLWIFDLDSRAVLEVVPMPATALTVNAINGIVYTLRPGAPWQLNIFDPMLPAGHPYRLTTIDLGGCPEMLVFNPSAQILYAAGRCTGVDVIDANPAEASYHTVVASIPAVAPVAVNRLTNRVYAVTNPESSPLRQALVIEGDPNKPQFNSVLAQIPITQQPSGSDPTVPLSFSLDPGRELLYAFVGYWYWFDWSPAGTVTVISTATNTLAAVWPVEQREGPFQILATPATHRIYLFGGFQPADVLLDLPPVTATTAAGGGVAPVTVEVGTASLTFSDVTNSGSTQIDTIDPAAANLALPGQFSLSGAAGYEITSTAGFTGPITICFDMSSVTDADAFSALRVLHGENGSWVDRTVTSDFATGRICASVTSLSPFAIASVSASYEVALLFDNTKAFKGGTVPLKVRLLSNGVNVSSALIAVSAKRLMRVSDGTTAATQDAGHANPDGNFRYNAALGGYIFNLDARSLPGGTYELSFRATGETTLHTLQFQVK